MPTLHCRKVGERILADGKIVIETGLDSSGIEKGLSKIQGLATKGMQVATTAIAGTATALGGVATAAVKVGSDFEAQMSRVQAISGATGDELEDLKNQAIQLGADTAFSAKEAAEGMENLAAAGFTTSEIMDAMPGMLNLAAAAGEDLATSSDIAASTLRGFGLEASDAAHVADVLAENANRTNSSVAETGEAMKYVSPLARAAGISMEETAAAIGIMANAGIQGSQAGTTLRGALSRLSRPTDAMTAAMEELGISFYDANGEMKSLTEQVGMLRKATEGMTDEQKNNYLVTLYGQEALSGMLALMNEGEGALSDLTEAYETCDGSAEKAAKTMQDNLQGAIEQLGGSAESLGIIFYESVSDNLKEAVQVVNDSVDDITDAFTKGGLDKAIEQAGDEFADLAVMAAEHAPDMVDAAIDFIESFAKGIKKNKKKLVNASGEMARTFVSGLAELLPEEVQAPVEDAIDAISESLSSGGLKNAGKVFAGVFEDGLDVIGELAEVALPLLTDAVDFLGDNIEVLGPLALGTFAAFKGYGVAVAAIQAVTLAQQALNTAMTLSPVGLWVAALAGLTVALGGYMIASQNAAEAEYGLSEAQEKTVEKAQQLNDQYDRVNDARYESMAGVEAEYGHLTQLKEELDTLIDTNGQVKKGYEDRANFIVGELSSALGLEKDQIWEIINANGSLGDSIDDLIEKKKAEAILNANQEAYTEAVKKQGAALQTYQESLELVQSTQEKYNKTQEDYNNYIDKYYELLKSSPEGAEAYRVASQEIINANEEAKKAYETAKQALSDSEEAYVGYNATIQNYEGLSSAIISGDSEKISQAMQNMRINFVTAETGTKESLERQVQNMRDTFANLQQAVIDGSPGVTNEMVTAAREQWTAAVEELDKFQDAAGESMSKAADQAIISFAQKNPDFLQTGIDAGLNADAGLESTRATLLQTVKSLAESSNEELGSSDTEATGNQKGQEYNTGLGSQKGNIDRTSQSIAESSDTILGSQNTSGTGQRKGTEYKSGLQSTQGIVNSTATSLSNLANGGLASANTSATGSQKGQEYVSGINSQDGNANSAGENLAENANSGAGSESGYTPGSDFGSGFVSGIENWLDDAASAARSLASRAYNAARKWLDEHSPSKKTRKVGRFFTQGMALGIEDDADLAEKASQKVSGAAFDALDLTAVSSRLRDVMALNTGRISQAITGQTIQPQYYNNYQKQEFDYDLLSRKLRNALMGLNMNINMDSEPLIRKTVREVIEEINTNANNYRRSKGYG